MCKDCRGFRVWEQQKPSSWRSLPWNLCWYSSSPGPSYPCTGTCGVAQAVVALPRHGAGKGIPCPVLFSKAVESVGCSGALAVEKREVVSAGAGLGGRHPSCPSSLGAGQHRGCFPRSGQTALVPSPRNRTQLPPSSLPAARRTNTPRLLPQPEVRPAARGQQGHSPEPPCDSHRRPAVPGDRSRAAAPEPRLNWGSKSCTVHWALPARSSICRNADFPLLHPFQGLTAHLGGFSLS